jgi:hypothetical protein
LDINIRPASKTEPVDEPVDARVTHIVFNSRLTGGVDLNGRPGDEGLMLVVEPRNADGQYVPLPGEVSIVVLDRSKTGQDARVARWDYESVETSRFLRKTLFGRGIHLELPWPNQPPESERLEVHVRYTTVDGRKLEAEREVQVDPLDQAAGGWTPASKPLAAQSAVPEQPGPPDTGSRLAVADDSSGRFGGGNSIDRRPIAPDPDSIGPGRSVVVSSTTPKDPTQSPTPGASTRSARRKAAVRRPRWSPYR